jgi:hypothetical protein
MTDFSIFDSMVTEYNKDSSSDEEKTDQGCKHEDICLEGGLQICTKCGEIIDRPILHEKDWCFYAGNRRSDPNRVHARKVEEKTISKDVVGMNFSDNIISMANDIYMEVTKGQIYRGGSRKAIIFACIFHAYKLSGNHQTPDNLITSFGLTRKAGLKGMKIVNVNLPKDSKIHQTKISPSHIICDIMSKFLSTTEQQDEVCKIYESIFNRSSKLNRARPQSVASAVIYYWICLNSVKITLAEFASITNLSELTIKKNKNEVERVITSLKTT